MFRRIILASAFLFSMNLFASEQKVINLLPEKDGTLTYIAKINGVDQKVQSKFVLGIADDLITKAKELACNLKLRPDSVDASIGVISFSWDTARLCSAKK